MMQVQGRSFSLLSLFKSQIPKRLVPPTHVGDDRNHNKKSSRTSIYRWYRYQQSRRSTQKRISYRNHIHHSKCKSLRNCNIHLLHKTDRLRHR